MMPNVFKIIIKQKLTIMGKARRRKWAQRHGIRLAWINEETAFLKVGQGPIFFAVDHHFRFVFCDQHISVVLSKNASHLCYFCV